MNENRQVALSIERQHIKHVKHYYRSLAEINVELAKIHKNIELKIDKNQYKYATEFVDRYISYTSIWNLKFVYNLENPEVALMQVFHLEYIFNEEPTQRFTKERRLLQEVKELFYQLDPYTDEHIERRKETMLQYIIEKSKNPTVPK